MTVKVKYVKTKLNKSAIKALQNRTRNELLTWAHDALRRKITPTVPIDTGRLRRNVDIQATELSGSPMIIFHWRQPYALAAEEMSKYGKSPRTPGTVSPYGVPGVERIARDEIDKPIGRAFKKKESKI